MKRTERLFAIAEALRARRTGVTAEELARRFEVSVRTIYRDLDSLRAAHMPLHSEQGRGGGFALERHYNLPPVNFSVQEAQVLLAAGELVVRHRWLPFVKTLAGALDKVRAALPTKMQRELQRKRSELTFSGVPSKPVSPEVRDVVEQAWLSNRSLHITYDGASGVTERRVKIRTVVMTRSETLLNATDLDINEDLLRRSPKDTLQPCPFHVL